MTEIASALATAGHLVQHDSVDHADFPGFSPTSILFMDDLADAGYERVAAAGSTPGQPSAVWAPSDEAAPIVSAVHTVPPMPWAMPLWSAGLDSVATRCDEPRTIVAGDLNAAVDHMAFLYKGGEAAGRCRDAATETESAARGTWPSNVPEILASPIDHILVGSAWTVTPFDVLDAESAPGSDHRPILAELRPGAGEAGD